MTSETAYLNGGANQHHHNNNNYPFKSVSEGPNEASFQSNSSSSASPSPNSSLNTTSSRSSTGNTENKQQQHQQHLDLINDPNIKYPLENNWSFWFYKGEKTKSWKENVKFITNVGYVEDFWA